MSAQERKLVQHSYQLQMFFFFFKAALHIIVIPVFLNVLQDLIGLQTLSKKGIPRSLVWPSS